ncbi:MAG: hypothetical protein ACREI9_04705 [Nitrospiraceae bacterium]
MKRFFFLLLVGYGGGAALAIQSACIEQTNLTLSGPSGGFGAVASSTIENLRVEPSQFELVNGQQATAFVLGRVGGVEVRDFDFTASIGPNSTIATIVQVSGNVVVFKAENPGNAALRIVAGSSSAEANIKVVPSN